MTKFQRIRPAEKDPYDAVSERGPEAVREAIESKLTKSPLDWTSRFMMSREEADEISDPEMIEDNLIVKGHLIAVPGPPGAGKTTIFQHYYAGRWAAQGYQVIYVNADVSASDAKRMVHEADQQGFQLLLPDMKAGLSMADVVKHLEQMAHSGGDFSNVVMIFDTLKKMVDVIQKSAAKSLYRTLRSLTAKGMTVIVLGHTNKYLGQDGKPVYEGTGDLRADVDELIYLIPQKNDDGSMTVSAEPDKVRAALQPMTFHIAPDRTVSIQKQYVNVAARLLEEQQREKDAPAIEAICEALASGKFQQVEIVAHCAEHKVGQRTVLAVLKRYVGSTWDREKGMQRNAWTYRLRTPGRCKS